MRHRTTFFDFKRLTYCFQSVNFRGSLGFLFGFLLIPLMIFVSQSTVYSQTAGYTQLLFPNPIGTVPEVWISTQFSQQESNKIKYAFIWLNATLRKDSDKTIGTLESRLDNCVRTYSSNSFDASASVSQAPDPVTRLNENLNIARGFLQARRLPSGNYLRRERRRIYIDRLSEENTVLGRGSVGINWNNGGFRIRLNGFQLAQSNIGIGEWAGTIIHEMMHNMGYTHAEVVDGNFEPVRGNLIYETGWCVKRGGDVRPEGTFGLTAAEGGTDFFVD